MSETTMLEIRHYSKSYGGRKKAADVYLPAEWFADAVTKHDLLGALLLIGVSMTLGFNGSPKQKNNDMTEVT